MRDVFSFLLVDIGVETRCREVMTITLSSPPTTPNISLVVLILFTSLGLVGGRLLGVFATRNVSKRSISRLIPSRVLLVFFCRSIPMKNL